MSVELHERAALRTAPLLEVEFVNTTANALGPCGTHHGLLADRQGVVVGAGGEHGIDVTHTDVTGRFELSIDQRSVRDLLRGAAIRNLAH